MEKDLEYVEFQESNMTFGPFEANHVFRLEKSHLYESLSSDAVKTVEFIYSRNFSAISFVEAKSSAPRPEENQQYVVEITDKFLHSFSLYCSVLLGRRGQNQEMSTELTNIDIAHVKIKFFLVIYEFNVEWLPPIQIELENKLKPYRKIWGMEVFVLNDTMAQKYHLVKA